MSQKMDFSILPQPSNTTCGATCLHGVYKFFSEELDLPGLIDEVQHLEAGGTLAVWLGCHALARGYKARIYTYNIHVFDPTWFHPKPRNLAERLHLQYEQKDDPTLRSATVGYLDFLAQGGEIKFEDLTTALIRKVLKRNVPIITGLSATYLYRDSREFGEECRPDDVRGLPVGHFVVLYRYDAESREVTLADPLLPNPLASTQTYSVEINRLINSVLLGIITHDANLLVIEPREDK